AGWVGTLGSASAQGHPAWKRRSQGHSALLQVSPAGDPAWGDTGLFPEKGTGTPVW
ncbi:hypothetical protein P7K49_001973, partial [Saguinus oedipus]